VQRFRRQIDLERGPTPGLAVDPDIAAGLFHDPVHGGEAQAGSLTKLLGGEERLEDMRLRFGIHPATGIAHGQHHKTPRQGAAVAATVIRIEFDVGCLDYQLAPVEHRIPSVDRQVHDDLLDLSRVGFDAAKVLSQMGFKLNVVANQTG